MAKGKKTGGGSRKGIPNRATADVRAAIAMIAQNQIANVERWLGEIEDPAKRVALFLNLCEYHIPRLARTELTGKDGIELGVVVLPRKEMTGDADRVVTPPEAG
jgi:hypothetical protein